MAGRLAEHGVRVVVFEMNPRPFGKIEDGLPRWHVGLRQKEYETIRAKLSRPGVEFVPCTKIGRDIPFEAIAREWGFSAVVLANGAWRDRPLPVEGAERYVRKGLISRKDVEKHIKSLPDREPAAAWTRITDDMDDDDDADEASA